METEPSSGEVITFYSYKGGTGRSMVLANIACLLARRRAVGDRRVLIIDWDLEAPGLHHYFPLPLRAGAEEPGQMQDGLIELFLAIDELSRAAGDAASGGVADHDRSAEDIVGSVKLTDYIRPTTVEGLDFIQAGRFDRGYAARVTTFDWNGLHRRSPSLFRVLAERLARNYAYVLIDSRTGETDTSGICTTLLPDKLVAVFVTNRQSLLGMLNVIRCATTYRKKSEDIRPLVVFPLVSRIGL